MCGDEEALENNAIVFCDGCGLALHQEYASMLLLLLLLLLPLMPMQMRQHSGCPRRGRGVLLFAVQAQAQQRAVRPSPALHAQLSPHRTNYFACDM